MRYALPVLFLVTIYAQPVRAAGTPAPTANAPTPSPAGAANTMPRAATWIAKQKTSAPAWIHWLGWSTDGKRFALRQGDFVSGNRIGKPIWIARLDDDLQIIDRLLEVETPKVALAKRGIARRGWRYTERLGANDSLTRTAKGQLFAVVLRGTPPEVAVLRRDHGSYRVIARATVRNPAQTLRVAAYERRDGGAVALIASTGKNRSMQATLFIVSTVSPAVQDGPNTTPPARIAQKSGEKAQPLRAEGTQSKQSKKRDETQRKTRLHPDEAHSANSLTTDHSARVSN